jgi:hypothetical protein
MALTNAQKVINLGQLSAVASAVKTYVDTTNYVHPTLTPEALTGTAQTPAFGGTVDVVTGVTVGTNGHTSAVTTTTITIPSAVATPYVDAENTGSNGLLSATDKAKLDSLATDFGAKADKVTGAVSGNFAGLDSNGNLTDSGSKAADFKTKQTAVADADATTDGTAATFVDSVTQNANGEITVHKKGVQAAQAYVDEQNPGQAGLMSAADKAKLDGVDYSGKADKVASATNGNFAGLDANGNLTDSGFKAADFQAAGSYKTTQEIVADPSADGTGITFIATASQNANGEITVTKKTVQTVEASTSGAGGQAGLMTAAQAEKLAGIATGAQVNVLEGITIANGAATAAGALTPDGNKGVTITIPNNTNQLTNGAGFQNASEVNTAIAAAIANLKTASFEVVANIPTVAEAEAGVIYLVAHAGHNPGTNDSYDEYVLINTGSNDEPVMAIEKIGNTDINLSNYWSKDEIGFATDQEVEDALDAVFNA